MKKRTALLIFAAVVIIALALFILNLFVPWQPDEAGMTSENVAGQSITASLSTQGTGILTSDAQTANAQCQDTIGFSHLPASLPSGDFSESEFQSFMDRIKPYEQYIREAAAFYNIDAELIKGIMFPENGGKLYDTGTYTIKDGLNTKIKVKRLCNGRCGLCKFAGGPGNDYNCKELDKRCWYFDTDNNQWTISSSYGYCSLMQTSPDNCKEVQGCELDSFLSGNPRDAIFVGAEHIKFMVGSYIKFASTTAKGLPDHNFYWAVAFAYNNGQGSMRTAINEITKLKYGGDYSRFNWWEITVADFEAIKDHFASEDVRTKPMKGRAGYPLSVLKALKLQNFRNCGQTSQIMQSINPATSAMDSHGFYAAQELTVPLKADEDFVYQVSPNFAVSLTHDLDIYARLREKIFLIAKDIEACHETEAAKAAQAQQQTNEQTAKMIPQTGTQQTSQQTQNTGVNKEIMDNCVSQNIEKNTALNLPPLLKLGLCHTDASEPIYVLCAESNDKVLFNDGKAVSYMPITYKFALSFTKPGLKNVNIKSISSMSTTQAGTTYTNANAPSQKVQISQINGAAFGDSITVAGGESYGYVSKLTELIKANSQINVKFDVYAKVGAATGKVKSLLFETLDQKQYTDVIIFAGINNICNSFTSITKDLQDMYTFAKSKGARVGAVTLLPFKGGSKYWTAECHANLIAVNSWIKTQAKDVDYVVDAFPQILDPDDQEQMQPQYTSDGLHPNPEGHSIIAEDAYEKGYKNLLTQAGPSSTISQAVPSQLSLVQQSIPQGVKLYTYTTACPSNAEPVNGRLEGIIVPDGISAGSNVDVYFYFHGMHDVNDQYDTLINYNCNSKGLCKHMAGLKGLNTNAVMVMFSGAKDSSDYGLWMKSDFKCFYDEALVNVHGLGFNPVNMQLMGHSGGGIAIKNVMETFITTNAHLPLKAVVYYDACYTWCSAVLDEAKEYGARMFSIVTLDTSPGGNVPPRKDDFKALTGVSIDDSTPNQVYPGVNNDQDVKVLYAKDLGHDQIPNKCFYNFLNEGQCVG